MEKQKRWQFIVIVAVVLLTFYNILPTVFYYGKQLRKPIEEKAANSIAVNITERINDQEDMASEWLWAFCKNLNISAKSIELVPSNPKLIEVTFNEGTETETFKRFLPRAGELISFVPSQLKLSTKPSDNPEKSVLVERRIGVHLNPEEASKFFVYSPKRDENGQLTSFYRQLVYERVIQLAMSLGSESEEALKLSAALQSPGERPNEELLLDLASGILEYHKLFGDFSPITQRYYSSFSRGLTADQRRPARHFAQLLEKAEDKAKFKRGLIQDELKEQGLDADVNKQGLLDTLEQRISTLKNANLIVKNNEDAFDGNISPFTPTSLKEQLGESAEQGNQTGIQTLDLGGRHPFVEKITIDWENDDLNLELYSEVNTIRENKAVTEDEAYVKERLGQLIINDIAKVSRFADEVLKPSHEDFVIQLNSLPSSTSIIAFDLGQVARMQSSQLLSNLTDTWNPIHQDLNREVFPVMDFDSYSKLPAEQQRLGLVVYAPAALENHDLPKGFRSNGIYVVARGLKDIMRKYEAYPESDEAMAFMEDFNKLRDFMQDEAFTGYPGTLFGETSEYANDFIFELSDYYSNLLKSSREEFSVKGNKAFAVLELSDTEQRILAQNKIEKEIHEDIMKWRDEYNAAQVDLDLTKKYIVPPPTRNTFWSNFKLNARKYFRGDDNKILKWGLDLSGGKMVRVGLRDQNNLPVTDEASLKQGLNELTSRVNKMGLSEVNLRIEGSNIALDFPGSQGFSASDLIKASSMRFHVVNEKFSLRNAALATEVQQFLQDVWNEAVVTNRKDLESINDIAWQHLGGGSDSLQRPRSEHAKTLFENGLRIVNPKESVKSNNFDDTLSSIAIFRGDDPSEWRGQSTPLFIAFHNYALEGSDLENVHAAYDPEKGNILSFGVKSTNSKANSSFSSPRESLHTWTSQFAQEKIAGTPKAEFTRGDGWRMAVILNGNTISEPTLNQPLRHHAMIYGKFSQREVNRLVADLKAGSLSFTPRILSEENISPELGKEERFRGISAAFAGLALVVATMISYYRFGGFIASLAVMLNLLIMWGILQNLDAALTLAGIAGIILTVGMAVDANVLIFERIREEYAISGRIASAVHTGYRKAFSAIVDSNVTTIIAALILMQFDSGPIKGFAITLIIGIASSMFTALFVTRYYFTGWVQNPKNKILNMANLIGKYSFDFLGKTKAAFTVSLIILVGGGSLLISEKQNILGMDFTGGYALSVNVEEDAEGSYRARTEQALLSAGANDGDFQIRQLNKDNHLRIQLGMSMEEEEHPFYKMPVEDTEKKVQFEYEKNPRIEWTVNTLSKSGLKIEEERLVELDKNWTSISGQFSDVMRDNAVFGLGLALLCILIYITIRFEFKYAISAILCVAHDVMVSMGVLGIFHKLGLTIQINMETIAAIMTIIGYSLNDTIIIFDRIREDTQIMRKKTFFEIVNHALNATLSRTVMTSATTLLVLVALLIFGGSLIFDFVFVMTIGIFIGTLSSWFIASPLLLYFHNKEEQSSH